MPVKQRAAKERRQTFDAETLALFARLDETPRRQREEHWFDKADYELHDKLGLGFERLCSQVSVLGRERSYHSPERPQQADDWRAVRRVRLALLEALGWAAPASRADGGNGGRKWLR